MSLPHPAYPNQQPFCRLAFWSGIAPPLLGSYKFFPFTVTSVNPPWEPHYVPDHLTAPFSGLQESWAWNWCLIRAVLIFSSRCVQPEGQGASFGATWGPVESRAQPKLTSRGLQRVPLCVPVGVWTAFRRRYWAFKVCLIKKWTLLIGIRHEDRWEGLTGDISDLHVIKAL